MTEDQLKQQDYYQDWKSILIPRLLNSEAWADLFDGISKVFAENIYSYVRQLQFIRDPDLQGKDTNVEAAEFLGFKYKSDIFTNLEYANLVKFLNIYHNEDKGTLDFVSFIGWIKNAKFKAYQLWAKGKKNYSDIPDDPEPFRRESPQVLNNSKVHGTGTKQWYPTSHVDLEYDALAFNIDERDIWYLFYKCAPIELVLRSIGAVYTADLCPWYIGTATGDYTRTHYVAPCIYRYFAPINMQIAYGIYCSETISEFAGYGYKNQGNPATTPLIGFDKNYRSWELSPQLTFKRDSIATNIQPGYRNLSVVKNNYPRMAYVPESSENHNVGLGLLIEPRRTNLLVNSGQVGTRTLNLFASTFTFSCKGGCRIRNVTDNTTIAEVQDSSHTFTLDDTKTISIVPTKIVQGGWFQLEEGATATSYIPTTTRTATREYEIASYNNIILPERQCTIKMAVSNDRIDQSCVLVRAAQDAFSYVEVLKSSDKILCDIYIQGLRQQHFEAPWQNIFMLACSKKQIKFNQFTVDFDQNNAPTIKNCYIGQYNGNNAINGYITEFALFPVYFSNFQ